MTSTFAFNFNEGEDEDGAACSVLTTEQQADVANSKGFTFQPQLHSIEDLLSHLPSALHFAIKEIPHQDGHVLTIPQREFYDIKAQLMAEDETLDFIPGISSEDLRANVYEGGYKTWECAEDLTAYLLCNEALVKDLRNGATIIELGAGTALPSLTLFQQSLRTCPDVEPQIKKNLSLILADYNQSVLQVSTIPNLFLTWAGSVSPSAKGQSLDVTTALKTSFLDSMRLNHFKLSAISGGWSASYVDLLLSQLAVAPGEKVLILASETIYAPTNLRTFTEVLMKVFVAIYRLGGIPMALVAAKKIYFGVGGGIDDFLAILGDFDGQGRIVWQSESGGIRRAIVEVSYTRP